MRNDLCQRREKRGILSTRKQKWNFCIEAQIGRFARNFLRRAEFRAEIRNAHDLGIQ